MTTICCQTSIIIIIIVAYSVRFAAIGNFGDGLTTSLDSRGA